jgi:uncharacterized protein YjbI with pentapeptide repeats
MPILPRIARRSRFNPQMTHDDLETGNLEAVSMAEPESDNKAWWHETLSSPKWWLHNIVVAIVVGMVVSVGAIVGQYLIDNRREERYQAMELRQSRQAEQLQNLQFVRSGSSRDPDQDRPYAALDLEGQELGELQLVGADFAYANLADTNLSHANLANATFDRADLSGANLTLANLTAAGLSIDDYLDDPDQPGATLDGANLRGTDLTGADLTRASLNNVYYDASTIWPAGFSPPPSRAEQ